MSNIDNERIKKYLGSVEERINFNKENGCKLLDCKVIDENIKLRQENIKLKKIAEKLAELILKEDINILNDICDKVPSKQCDNVEEGYCDKCIIDWARKEVENES